MSVFFVIFVFDVFCFFEFAVSLALLVFLAVFLVLGLAVSLAVFRVFFVRLVFLGCPAFGQPPFRKSVCKHHETTTTR